MFGLIPLAHDFYSADKMITRFSRFMEENERTTDVRDQLSEAAIEDLWAAIVNSFEAGKHPSDEISSDDQDESTGREGGDSKETTKETEEIDEKQEEANVVAAYSEIATRLRGALPNTVVDLQRAAKIGSAKHSLPNFIRTDRKSVV